MIMNSNSIVRPVTRAVFAASVLACAAFCGAAEEDSRWVHPLCQPLAVDSNGPFVELADGSLMTIDAQGMRVSQDDGKTWSEAQRVCEGLDGLREGREPASSSIVRTRRRRAGHRLSGFHHVQLQLGQTRSISRKTTAGWRSGRSAAWTAARPGSTGSGSWRATIPTSSASSKPAAADWWPRCRTWCATRAATWPAR